MVRLLLRFLLLGVGIVLAFSSSARTAEEGEWNVVILHSYHKGYPWTEREEEGIRSLFKGYPSTRFFVEFLDTKRLPLTRRYMRRLKDFYRFKYRDVHVDVVIVTDNNALTFLVRNHEDLFPGVPVVFCGVNNFHVSMLQGDALVTGVPENDSPLETLKLALKLHPGGGAIYYVVDNNTLTGTKNLERFKEAVEELGLEERAVVIAGAYLDRVLERVSKIPPEAVVLEGSSFFKDQHGVVLSVQRCFEKLSSICKAPVFSMWDFVLGHGIVGGYVVSGFEQGKAAGEMALEVLQGTPPWEIPILGKSPNRYMFDYRQLRRFGIPLSRLPKGSLVINRPESFYAKHKSLVWYTVLFLLMLLLVIVLLSVNIVKRRKAEEKLRDSEAIFRALVEQALVGVFILTADRRYPYLNRAAAEMLGYSVEEMVNNIKVEDIIHPEDLPLTEEKIRKILEGEKDSDSVICRFFTKGGQIRWLESFGKRILYGDSPAILGTAVDVTERVEFQRHQERYSRQLEEEVKLRTEELQSKVEELEEITERLEMANAELEAFTFSVSHDLRAPLRAMEGFAEALEEDFGEHLPPEAKRYLERITLSARKMDKLIEDLLRYSRISKQEITLGIVDLDRVVEGVLDQMRGEIEGVGAQVMVEYPLGRVMGHNTVLEHVVSNLLANALKFIDKERCPDVRVYSERLGSQIRVWIVDNGIGIGSNHLAKIFYLFERLHGEETYPGTGVGLAIVKRGVERMGGKVGVESTLGKGSRFWFELPAV